MRQSLRLSRASSALAAVLVAKAASADVDDWQSHYDPGPAERRSGFAAGVTFAAIVGNVVGFPNEVAKIDDPDFRASTGAAAGPGGGFWLGAAVRDWLVVGAGASFGTIAGSDGRLSNGGAFVLHLEVFPLFYRGGAWRDLGVVGEFGAGGRDIFEGSRETADGGVTSYASVGVLYEPLRAGRYFSAGPILLISRQFSHSLTATLATAGLQLAFYGGPG